MAGGLVIVGLGGFGFLAALGHTTSVMSKAALTALYMIGNVVGPGLFAGLEQETSRVVSSGLAAGVDARAGLRRASLVGAALAGLTMVALLAAAPLLVVHSFAGHAALLVWLLLGMTGSAELFLMRGILGGTRRFGAYAATLAVEGLARLLPCLAVAALGIANVDVNLYGVIFAIAPCLAAVAAWPSLRRTHLVHPSRGTDRAPRAVPVSPGLASAPVAAMRAVEVGEEPSLGLARGDLLDGGAQTPRPGVAEAVGGHGLERIARGVALLGVATLLAQVVANLAPLVVTGRLLGSRSGELTAVAFGFAFVLARVPGGPLRLREGAVLAGHGPARPVDCGADVGTAAAAGPGLAGPA